MTVCVLGLMSPSTAFSGVFGLCICVRTTTPPICREQTFPKHLHLWKTCSMPAIRGDKNLTPANQEFNYLNNLKDALNKEHHVFFVNCTVCARMREAEQTRERALFTVCVSGRDD